MPLNFNEVTDASQCDLYFEGLSTYTDLSQVADLTKGFRDTFGIKYSHGFLIDIDTIKDLIAQNGGDITGIRIYLGYDPGALSSMAVAVATIDPLFTDYGIPVSKGDPCTAILAEGRPCPYECGENNALNKS